MSTRRQSPGRCPNCGVAVPPTRVLIEYDRGGDPAAYAECPDCRGVVRPR